MDESTRRTLQGAATEPKGREISGGREGSSEDAAYRHDAHRLLDLAETAMIDMRVPPVPPVTRLVAEAERRAGRDARPAPGPLRRPRHWRNLGLLAVAAALGFVVLDVVRSGGGGLLPGWGGSGGSEFSLGAGEFVTGAAETATVVLADGSVVRLAPESRLRILPTRGTREVSLVGKAFFAVAAMDRVPFRIRTLAEDVVVLGTRFELQARSADDLRLVVIEGRVALGTTARSRVEVDAGEMGLISGGVIAAPVKVADARSMVPWLERFIVFQETPLHEVARELGREYDVDVQVTDTALARHTVTGWYADRQFEDVLSIVCAVLQASCSIDGRSATIGPQPVPSSDSPLPRGSVIDPMEQ